MSDYVARCPECDARFIRHSREGAFAAWREHFISNHISEEAVTE